MAEQMQGERLTLSERLAQLDAWALALPRLVRGILVLMSLVNMSYLALKDSKNILDPQKEVWFNAQLGLGLSNQLEIVTITLSLALSLCLYMYFAPSLFFMPPETPDLDLDDQTSLDD